MNELNIDSKNVAAILINEGWVSVDAFDVVSLTLPGGTWKTACRFRDTHGREGFLPFPSVLGVLAKRHVETAEEVAEREAEQREAEAILFRRIHRTDRETHDRLSAEQHGVCACGTTLGDAPWTHYVADEDGARIACNACSPYRHLS